MSLPHIPTPASGLVRFAKHDFTIAAVIAIVASGATFALGFALGWFPNGVNLFEVFAATLNYGATYLSIKQRRFAYTLGFVASAFWAVAYYQYNLLGSAILSLYLVGQLIYGYFRWGPDAASRPVHKFQWKWAWAYALATVLTYLGAVGIITLFGGSFAFWDGAILVLTILAQFLLDNKVLSSWFVWTAVNVIGVTLYATAGAPFAAVQQLLFGLANIWGYLAWKKSMENSSENFSEGAISKIQPKEESRLTFTDESTGESPIIKRLVGEPYSGSSKVDATFHPSQTFILASGQVPKIKDGETWRRLVRIETTEIDTQKDGHESS